MNPELTILIADDRPDNVELVRDLLSLEGYRVVSAVDGQEALDRIREHLPDLVLLDLDMPRLNGFQVCEALKADPVTADIPILMLTAWSAPDQRVKGLQLGAEDYMGKPFDYRELLARVKTRLRAKQEADHLREMQYAIRRTFERYVPVHVVEQLLENPTEVSLGGRLQEVTALFADLRGYTTLSEILAVEELVDVLNGHLTVAARAVLAYDGTISQYAGDLVMAIFNAPLPQSDHALRAVCAGRKLQADIAAFHNRLPEHLRMEFGIGIASGPAVVGNIGAREQLRYTAIGDTINLAQRLEELAPGGQILLTERTCELLNCSVTLDCRGPVVVRGRTEPVSIYALVDLPGDMAL
ncbi:MAG TPA: adenylate/guanylate cyclase domain-containing response regulator [Halothiobacillaceae bacterium]|nr:adenylate/guanylate cyclase domain-containing response regulator [Halothiobacillaceae bacterium]